MQNNNIKKLNFILLCSCIVLFDIFLIFAFVGDILILNGSVDSYIIEEFGIYPLVYSLVIEISLTIFSIIFLIIAYRKYKYGKE